MQVSSANSLTWLQSASAATSQSDPAGSTDGQDMLDASGAEGASPSSLMASLQSPSQQFSAGGLSALISAQLDQSTAGATASVTDPTSSDAIQTSATSGDASQAEPPSGSVRHHHHHGGGAATDPGATQPSTTPSTADASASPSTADAETEMAQLLTGM